MPRRTRARRVRRSSSRSPDVPGTGGERSRGRRPATWEAGVKLLAGRALTEQEVRDRLGRRGHPPEEIERTVAALRARGYLDDAQLAYNQARSLATRRFYGRARVVAELRRRGVPAGVLSEALQRAFADLDEDALAIQAARKAGQGSPERAARSLLRRGWSRGAVAKALRAVAGTAEDDLRRQDDDHDDFETDT